jgi:hypothetical protein
MAKIQALHQTIYMASWPLNEVGLPNLIYPKLFNTTLIMAPQTSNSSSSQIFLTLSDDDVTAKLAQSSKFKQRSETTYQTIHLPELNSRLNLNLALPLLPAVAPNDDPFMPQPELENHNKIEVVYLGNSMLERLKTTGKDTRLANIATSWNAGCGGDKTENVAYRLGKGMYGILKKAQAENEKCDIKVWVLASGTNNLHPKRAFREQDCQSFKVLVESCLRIAPESRVLVCDMFYRKDILDEVVDKSNEMLREVVREIESEVVGSGEEKRLYWIEGRKSLGKEMLVDHVHLNEEGYAIWDAVLSPLVEEALRSS